MSFLACLVILASLCGPRLVEAATRLGVLTTAEERTQWQARMTDNVGTINGFTYQSIYENRILGHANDFRSQGHPGGDGFWAGYTGGGCVPAVSGAITAGSGGTPWGEGNGLWIMRAAFVYFLTGDTSYADPVRTELLALTNTSTNPGADFGNTSKWCRDGSSYGTQARVYVQPWVGHVAHAYDYLLAGGYAGLSAGEKAQIGSWLVNAATWFMDMHLWGMSQGHYAYTHIFDEPQDFTCYGWCSDAGSPYYFGGPTPYAPAALTFFNQVAVASNLAAFVGVQQGHTGLQTYAKKHFYAYIRAGTFDSGAQSDFNRWMDCSPPCPGSTWGHQGPATSALVQTADIFARNGDTSLYDYTVPAEMLGSTNAPVNLLTSLVFMANAALKTPARLSYIGGTPDIAISWDTEPSGGGAVDWFDLGALAANMYYQNATVRAAMTRASPMSNSNLGGIGCRDAKNGGCFNGGYVSWPDLPFMYGNLDGVVNPYGPAGTSPPTCTVSAPSTFPIYDTATTPMTTLAGSATAPGGFGSVAWANDRGGSGSASGTTAWTVASIPLQTGTNVVTVTVTDSGALTGTCQLRVRYQTAADTTSNLRMHLPLDEGTGTLANDATVNNHDGMLSGAYTWLTGHIGPWAVRIDGPTGLLTVTGLLTSPAAVTLEAAFRLSGVPAPEGDVLTIGSAVTLRVSSTAIAGLFYDGSNWQFTSVPWTPDTAWHSLAYMAKAGEQTLYLDGVLRQYTTFASAPIYTGPGSDTIIGNHCCGGAYALQGTVDNPRVWTRYLSQVDLQAALAAPPIPPTITITAPTADPTYTTTVSPLTTLAGQASDADGTITGVTWQCTPGCGSGAANISALPTWTIPSVSLLPGTNNITVIATDNAGQTAQDSLAVLFPTSTPTVYRLIQ